MKFYALLFIFFFAMYQLQGQGILTFVEETHDFGTIEEGAIATYEFEFTNTGDQPLEISNVQASCGCTTPFFTREAVMPGKKGKIKASFDSNGRPGPFMKSITVRSNAKKDMVILYIKGVVNERKEKSQVGSKYNALQHSKPEALPPMLVLERENLDFGKVESGIKVKQRFNIYNSGQTNLVITALENKSKAISFGLSTSILSPGEMGILEITLDASQTSQTNIDEDFIIRSNDPKNPDKALKVKAEIYENFGKKMFKDKAKTPGFE